MCSKNQLDIEKLMNLSEAKANIDTVDQQFSRIRHLLDDVIGAMASAGELDLDTAKEYKTIETEIFHVTKFIESLGFDVRSKKREVESRMFKTLADPEGK